MIRSIIVIVFGLTIFFRAEAQMQGAKPSDGKVYEIVEQMPDYAGDLKAYLSENTRYPVKAKAAKLEGRVILKFIVNEDGSISDVKVMRGLGGDCDEEAVRVISTMPKWIAGKQAGKNVRVSMMLPIPFSAQTKGGKTTEVTASGDMNKNDDDADEYIYPAQMPSFPGAIRGYLNDNMIYPPQARAMSLKGTVILRFLIGRDGSISDIKIIKGIGGGCDEEAKRLVEAMPKWIPGRQNGKNVKVRYTMSIDFKYEDVEKTPSVHGPRTSKRNRKY